MTSHQARRLTQLIDVSWGKFTMREDGTIPHVYSLSKDEYESVFELVKRVLYRWMVRFERGTEYNEFVSVVGQEITSFWYWGGYNMTPDEMLKHKRALGRTFKNSTTEKRKGASHHDD